MSKRVDVKVRNCGTLWQVFPLTKKAKVWVAENVQIPDYLRFGASFVAEHRYGPDLVAGMRVDGLMVQDC